MPLNCFDILSQLAMTRSNFWAFWLKGEAQPTHLDLLCLTNFDANFRLLWIFCWSLLSANGLGPGGLDIWDPLVKGISYEGSARSESQTTRPQTTNLPGPVVDFHHHEKNKQWLSDPFNGQVPCNVCGSKKVPLIFHHLVTDITVVESVACSELRRSPVEVGKNISLFFQAKIAPSKRWLGMGFLKHQQYEDLSEV